MKALAIFNALQHFNINSLYLHEHQFIIITKYFHENLILIY